MRGDGLGSVASGFSRAGSIADRSARTGRSGLIEWVNTTLELRLSSLDQLQSGAVYCQLLDAYHPGVISMSKVNFGAQFEHEFTPNYKQLQQGLASAHIDK
ncbi:hypothetical protein WJX84_000976, partial [Apatococcus fuscideae]